MAIPPYPLITAPHPLLSPPSIFTFYRRPWQLPVTAMARRPHGSVDFGRWTTATFTLLHFPTRPSPDPALAHHARPCFCTQVSHMTAEGCLCLSSAVGERSAAGVDTYPYFSAQISSSRLRPRRLIQHMGARTNLASATTSCLHSRVQFPWLSASGITLSRGVGKKMDVLSC